MHQFMSISDDQNGVHASTALGIKAHPIISTLWCIVAWHQHQQQTELACVCLQSEGSVHPVHIPYDLQQPTAAEAAREEEEYGLNTPAPGKGDGSSSSSSDSSSNSISRVDGSSQ
jgi:hypothetical protein